MKDRTIATLVAENWPSHKQKGPALSPGLSVYRCSPARRPRTPPCGQDQGRSEDSLTTVPTGWVTAISKIDFPGSCRFFPNTTNEKLSSSRLSETGIFGKPDPTMTSFPFAQAFKTRTL